MRLPILLTALPFLGLSACTDHSSGGPGAGVLSFVGFETRQSLATGVDATRAVVSADFDGDGRVDLAAADADGRIQIMLNQGGGRLAPGSTIAGPAGPTALCAKDLDDDLDVDLVVVATDGQVQSLRNHGFGDFSPFGAGFECGADTVGFALSDVDGDQVEDLVVARQGRTDVQFHGGIGDGTFRGSVAIAMPRGHSVTGVVAGDFDGDGLADLALADVDADRAVFALGDASGMPARHVMVDVGDRPFGIAVGDVTADGQDDLVVASPMDGTLEVIAHVGNGTFEVVRTIAIEGQPALPAIGDVTGDGLPDLLCSVLDRRTLAVLPFRGGQIVADGDERPLAGSPMIPHLADMNRDGAVDVIVGSWDAPVANMYRGRTGGLVGGRMFRSPGVPSPEIVAAADLDGDGSVEVVASGFESTAVSVMRSGVGSSGGVDLAPGTPIEMSRLVRHVVPADLDRDGRLDLLVAVEGGVRILANRSAAGALAFEGVPSADPHELLAPADGPFEMSVADMDGDGALDLVVAYVEGNRVSMLRGDPSDPFRFAAPVGLALSGRPVGMAAGDFDGDGDAEIAVSRLDAAAVAVIELVEDRLELEVEMPVGAEPNYLRTADFNRDGREDVVVSNGATESLTVMFGERDGFRVVVIGAGRGPTALLTRDLNRDGFADVLVASLAGADFRVLLGDGSGGFQQALVFPGVYTASSAAFADLDGDGLEDLVIGSLLSKRVATFRNVSRVE